MLVPSRKVLGARLESLYTVKGIVGSNPTLSAIFQGLPDLYLAAKIEYYKNMKQKKSLTQKQYAECYVKALTYIAQILVGAFFVAALIFPIF